MRKAVCLTAAMLCLACTLLGCEEDVVLVVGTDRPYSLYGVLHPPADTQYVFVFPIEGTLTPLPGEPLDARFTSTDLQTGEVRVWSDSLLRDHLGLYRHVYWSAFRPAYGHTYRLEAQKPDGRTTRVQVTVPPFAFPVVGQTLSSGPVSQPVVLPQSIPRLLKTGVTFYARTISGYDPVLGIYEYFYGHVRVPYDGRALRNQEGWLVLVNHTEGYKAVFDSMSLFFDPDALRSNGIELLSVTLDLIAANAEWNPPGGVFDTLALVHPVAMTNVENGFGFVGAGYRIREQWRPGAEVAEAAGFRRPGGLGPR